MSRDRMDQWHVQQTEQEHKPQNQAYLRFYWVLKEARGKGGEICGHPHHRGWRSPSLTSLRAIPTAGRSVKSSRLPGFRKECQVRKRRQPRIDQVFGKFIWKTSKEVKKVPLLPFSACDHPHPEYVTQKHTVSMDENMNEHVYVCVECSNTKQESVCKI